MVENDGRQAVKARSDCSASLLYVPVSVDLQHTPRLQWQWKIEEGKDARSDPTLLTSFWIRVVRLHQLADFVGSRHCQDKVGGQGRPPHSRFFIL